MKLDVIRFGCALSALWALTVLCVGAGNLFWPAYGVEFLRLVDSIYPGYHYGKWGFVGVVVATLYAALDGWVAGVVFAWMYNLFTRKKRQ